MLGGPGARRGFKRETYFCSLVNEDLSFKHELEEALKELGVFTGEILSAENVKGVEKSDVNLMINHNHFKKIGCSLKSAQANFNQLDRRWLSQWAEVLGMPSNIRNIIQSSLDRKTINSRDIFITQDQEKYIIPYLTRNIDIVLRELFTKDDNDLKLFIVYNENAKEWYISKVEDIISFLKRQEIKTSSRGVLYFGSDLTLQRKGGDGNITNPPKSSPLHPSNQLQFKIRPLSIINEVRKVTIKDN